MRIVVSDYSGHPFQVQLSRELARQGHQVCHVFSEVFQTPKGKLQRSADDPEGFSIVGVRTRAPFAKHSFVKRRGQELEIGKRIGEVIARFNPDVVLSSNAPLDAQRRILAATRRARARFVFWVQDIYSAAITKVLDDKLGFPGRLIGKHYQRLEARLLAASDHIVAIAQDFVPELISLASVPASRIAVIENWAPLDELVQWPRDSDWAQENLPDSAFRIIYSGTLGFKHNPELLVHLAKGIDGEVIVFSEGPAADSLRQQAETLGIANLHVRGWLPFDELSKALSGADALVVILEPEAGIYSVPSKVLTYLCAGKAILGAIPSQNLAARLISEVGAGLVVTPTDSTALVPAAAALAMDADRRTAMGMAARRYAEATFDVEAIARRFESVFEANVTHKESNR